MTVSGYGNHAREVAKWLLSKKDVDVKFVLTPWGDTPWIVDRTRHGGLIDEIVKRSAKPSQGMADVSIQLQLPNEWDPKLATVNVGITAGVETDRCNPSWITSCSAMDAVVVPSTHVADCFTNTGIVNKLIHVVPESYGNRAGDRSTNNIVDVLPELTTAFNFLVFGQITGNSPHNDRKNTFNTVKWLCEAFRDDPDVGIVIKTNVGRNSLIDLNITTSLVKKLLEEVRRGPFPKVYLVHGDVPDADIAAIYAHPKVKALVSLTRGEGFGLPILEAAASGLPIIATGWSGHMDYLKHGKFINVDYVLQDVHPSRVDNNIFMKGARWAEASSEDVKKKLTKFRNSSTIPESWATELATKVVEKYSFDEVCKQYDVVLGEVIK
jgi:glycosyltransferase involved in cell wall biosynthesis